MWMRRRVTVAVLLAVALLHIASGTVQAHKGKLPEDALTLVRQAVALLAQNPGMTGEVRERLQAALKSRKPEGVRLGQVAEALQALERGDVATARRLLTLAIMPAGMPMPAPGPGGSAAPRLQVQAGPAQTGPAREQRASPSAETAMRMSEPLRVCFGGSMAEILLLAVGLGLVGLGLFLLRPEREEGAR